MSKEQIELDFSSKKTPKSFKISKPVAQILEFIYKRVNEGDISVEGLEKDEGKKISEADIIEKALWDLFEREGFEVSRGVINIEVPKKYQ